MQNAGIAKLGLDWRYLAFDVHPDRLAEVLLAAGAMGFIGLNLTVPHKLLAFEQVDVVDPSAKPWGAVNTIRFEGRNNDGEWRPLIAFKDGPLAEVRSVGFNTDADAIVRSINEDLGLPLVGTAVTVLGAGGAGRAAALRIAAEKPASLTLINRTREKAAALADEIRKSQPTVHVSIDYPDTSADLLLNATSLGLKADDALPVDEDWLRANPPGAVYDMIYQPAETPLLKLAKSLERPTANGLGMLLHQGADALEIWSGMTAPRDVMREALQQHMHGR